MSFVDFEPKPQPQPSFSDWLQEYWQHPHPQGVIAMLKAALNSVPDMANGSIAAMGASPSTEEEAFRYNLARDRGAIGAFRAASTFGPSAPQFVAAVAGRHAVNGSIPQALEERLPGQLNRSSSGNIPGPSALPSPDRFRVSTGGWPSSNPVGSVPSVPPSGAGTAPSGGLLGRLRELEALERRTPASNTGLVLPGKDPNFRQLSRVLGRPLEVAPLVAGRNDSPESRDPGAQNVEALSRSPRQDLESINVYEQRVDGSNFPGYGGRGGGPGKGGGGRKGGGERDDDDDDDGAHPCTQRWMDEISDWCPQFWKAGERWVSACEDRAAHRSRLCYRNGGSPDPEEPDRYDWSQIPRKRIKTYSLRPKK